ncbi:MAG TPA: hypothetical protein PLO67_23035, partial [Saprospiraceae bacterium]|nr:hypothetical protein [Saprospiraceae bacterium]HPI09174.1 hypothetical protein [Saprospiraceae bacterium]
KKAKGVCVSYVRVQVTGKTGVLTGVKKYCSVKTVLMLAQGNIIRRRAGNIRFRNCNSGRSGFRFFLLFGKIINGYGETKF